MAQDESLRLVAEVVDRFSGPLRTLRSHLQGMARDGNVHAEAVQRSMNRVETATRSAGQAASTVLNPALAAVGITGLGVTAALMGVGSALRNFGGSVSALGALGREAGMAADQLRVFQSLAGRFGISSDASASAARAFAQNMRDIRRGVGETMGFLQSQNPEVAQFALKLKGTANNDEALKLVEDFLEQIPNAVDRGRFAEKLLGSIEFGRLGDKHLGPIRKLREEIARSLGPLDPKTVESAEQFERAMSALQTTMQRLGTAIATEAMPHVSEFVKGLSDLVKGGREDITGPLRDGIREVGTALREIDWAQASRDARDLITGAAGGVKDLLTALKDTLAVLRLLREGEYGQALRRGSGGNGPLARKLAPMEGDDVIAKTEQVEALKQRLQGAENAKNSWLGRLGLAGAGDPELIRKQLDVAQRELEEMTKLRDELRRTRESQERKPQDGEAKVQQQSFDGLGGPFGGARVQTASLGSMARVGGMLRNRQGGIYAPGGDEGGPPAPNAPFPRSGLGPESEGRQEGPDGQTTTPHRRPDTSGIDVRRSLRGLNRRFSERPPNADTPPLGAGEGGNVPLPAIGGARGRGDRSPNAQPPTGLQAAPHALDRAHPYGGGRFNGLGFGRPVAPIRLREGGPGEEVARTLKGDDGRMNARQPEEPGQYRPQYPLGDADLDQRVVNTIAGEVSTKNAEGVDAVVNNMMNRVGSKGWGPSGNLLEVARAPGQYAGYRKAGEAESEFVRSRIRAIASGGVPDNTAGANSYRAESYYRKTKDRGRGYWAGRAAIGPNVGGNRYAFEAGIPNGPYAPYDPNAIASAKAPPTETANGDGFASRMRAMQSFEGKDFAADYRQRQAAADKQRASFGGAPQETSLMSKAIRSGALGASPTVNANGRVDVKIEKPGPDTRVRTASSGELFKEVRLSRGRAMAEASQDN